MNDGPTIEALREELLILGNIQDVCGQATIRAREHDRAGVLLGYLEKQIQAKEAELAAALPPQPAEPEAVKVVVNLPKLPEEVAPDANA